MPGPRGCDVCGPGAIEGCWKCGATYGHRHVVVVGRNGTTLGRVAACDLHAPADGVLTHVPGQNSAQAADGIVSGRRKLAYDRARRRAIRRLREAHADEWVQLLDEEVGR